MNLYLTSSFVTKIVYQMYRREKERSILKGILSYIEYQGLGLITY